MLPTIRRSLAPILLALAAVAIAGEPARAQAPMPPTKVSQLMQQALAEVPGREVRMIVLDIPAGGGSGPHRHPGHYTFGYVLEGAYRIKVDDGAEQVLTAGQTFYEAPGQLHAVSRNGSDSAPAKVLVVVVMESGKPLVVPEKP